MKIKLNANNAYLAIFNNGKTFVLYTEQFSK